MSNAYEKAEMRFKQAQRRLEDFVQAHVHVGFGGLDFLDVADSVRLDQEYAALRSELDAAGAAWARTLAGRKEQVHV